MTDIGSADLLALTAEIVAALVSNNQVEVDELPALIAGVHEALDVVGRPQQLAVEPQQPAVPIRSSVKPDHIVCLEDGERLTLLKRHLKSRYGMTPAEYRAKWDLPHDYPMVAPAYAARRRALAQKIGLGRKAAALTPAEQPVEQGAGLDTAAPAQSIPAASAAPAPHPSPMPQRARRTLSIRINKVTDLDERPATAAQPHAAGRTAGADHRDSSGAETEAMLRAAISGRTCIQATYNRNEVLLAPHILYVRHDEPYVRAVTIERDGRKPREIKMGTFKVAGLARMRPTPRGFVPQVGLLADQPPAAAVISTVHAG